jgi:repressor LexA
MKRLTRRQQDVLEFVEQWVQNKHYPPSVREIANHFGLQSASGIHKHLKALERKGFIAKENFLSRSIRVLRPTKPEPFAGGDTLNLPIVGILLADGSIARPNDSLAPITVAMRMLPEPRDAFAVRVECDEFAADGLLRGDWMLVMPHHPVRNGLVVLATLHATETQVRRFHRDQDLVRLERLSQGQSSVELPAREVHVQGVVAGIWRPYG